MELSVYKLRLWLGYFCLKKNIENTKWKIKYKRQIIEFIWEEKNVFRVHGSWQNGVKMEFVKN